MESRRTFITVCPASRACSRRDRLRATPGKAGASATIVARSITKDVPWPNAISLVSPGRLRMCSKPEIAVGLSISLTDRFHSQGQQVLQGVSALAVVHQCSKRHCLAERGEEVCPADLVWRSRSDRSCPAEHTPASARGQG